MKHSQNIRSYVIANAAKTVEKGTAENADFVPVHVKTLEVLLEIAQEAAPKEPATTQATYHALEENSDGGSDYVMTGPSCWIETGGYTMYLKQLPDGKIAAEFYSKEGGISTEIIASINLPRRL